MDSKHSNTEAIKKDQELIELVRNSNDQEREMLFKDIYERHKEKCMGFMRLKFGDRSGIEDIYNIAFNVLCDKINDPRFQLICQIQTYLNRVSLNQGLTAFGKHKIDLPPEDDIRDIKDEYFFPMEELVINERIKAILTVLDDETKISPKCREIIRRSFLQEQSPEQIMKAMNYDNTDVVKTTKFRCLTQLKEKVFKMLKGK